MADTKFPKKNSRTEQMSLRLPHELMAQVDRVRAELDEASAYRDVTRADAVRQLLREALSARDEGRKI